MGVLLTAFKSGTTDDTIAGTKVYLVNTKYAATPNTNPWTNTEEICVSPVNNIFLLLNLFLLRIFTKSNIICKELIFY